MLNLGKSWGLTRNIPSPNLYVQMLPEYMGWIFLEEEAASLKGKWRTVFEKPGQPLDLEIGCGNGFFFEQQVRNFPARNLLGIELKYKPLVQTVRRVKEPRDGAGNLGSGGVGLGNGRGLRFHARYVDRIFDRGELDNVYIYFPDPWPKTRHHKNRLLRADFLEMLAALQKPGTFVDIKTDSLDYFKFFEEELTKVKSFKLERHSLDLHHSAWASENFMTSFEKIFTKKGQPIYYARLTNSLANVLTNTTSLR